MAKSLKNIRIKHLYDFSELYQIIYNRNDGYKMQEAVAFANIAFRLRPKSKSIMELLSGADSKHARYFKEVWPHELAYSGTDGTESSGNPNILHVRDITKHDFKQQWDLVTAHYYSPSSVCDMDNGGLVTRACTQGFINTAFNATKKGGIFIMDFCSDGYSTAICADANMSGKVITQEFYADFHTPLYKWLVAHGLASATHHSDVDVVARVSSHYDRLTANNIDKFHGIKIKVDGKVVVAISIKNPFCQRYFSDPELTDMMLAAGFNDVQFWNVNYADNDFSQLDRFMTWDEDEASEDELEAQRPNVLVGIKK